MSPQPPSKPPSPMSSSSSSKPPAVQDSARGGPGGGGWGGGPCARRCQPTACVGGLAGVTCTKHQTPGCTEAPPSRPGSCCPLLHTQLTAAIVSKLVACAKGRRLAICCICCARCTRCRLAGNEHRAARAQGIPVQVLHLQVRGTQEGAGRLDERRQQPPSECGMGRFLLRAGPSSPGPIRMRWPEACHGGAQGMADATGLLLGDRRAPWCTCRASRPPLLLAL